MFIVKGNSFHKVMGKKTGICQLCKKEKRFAKAHIISKSLFKSLFKRADKTQLLDLTQIEDDSIKNVVEDAFFDNAILCIECDRSFSDYENYFNKFISDDLRSIGACLKEEKYYSDEYRLVTYSTVDHYKLRMFFLITLWRCSISKQLDFKHINLGDSEEEVFKQIKSGNLGNYERLAVVMISLKNVDDIRTETVLAPIKATIGHTPVYIFMIKQIAFIINLQTDVIPYLFQHRLLESEQLDVVQLNHNSGINFLNIVTKMDIHVKKEDLKT